MGSNQPLRGSASAVSLSPDSRFGAYEIIAPLGAGGMGEIYRARDPRLGREIAIKILPSAVARDDDRRRRFETEARSASALNHPSIVTIHEFGEVDSTFYIAMELVEGDTLRALLETGTLPLRRVIQIAAQVAEGLAKAHEAGIVHRDLKPENVMVTRDGYAKILDFGLAKLALPDCAEAATLLTGAATQPGVVLGTVAYMSPEQASGRPLDFRSDQFSLGVMLYEALAGKPAFLRDSQVETLTAILRDAPPSIGRLNGQVPAPLCWLVDRCLSKSPDERYSSTRDLARDLATIRDCFLAPAPVTESRASNLPAQRTTFVGRERELEAVAALVLRSDVRLVTLTGPGGIGKTRLALQAAERNTERFPGGVHFVPLGNVNDPALAPALIVQALGIRVPGGQPALHTLKEHLLGCPPLLLVLDNLEHLLAAAPVISDLLATGGSLKVLATSRAPLSVYGEHEFPVPPLSAPPPRRLRPLEEVRQSAAVELFVQRAAAVKPDFELTRENAAAVANICTRLDGLPLAIELAAARVKLLSPQAIESRLQSRLQLLTGGARDLPERQQTLRGTIDWSYDLLTPEEQKLFRRLSVFTGGCTLEAIEAVCNFDEQLGLDVLDGTASIVNKSLVQQLEGGGETRFAMLETIREYGAMRLAESGEERATRRAHAAYVLVLAEEGASAATDEERTAWLDRIELEHDNVRAALDGLVETGNADWGLRLGAAMFRFWETREHLAEGRARLNRILHLPAAQRRTRERARVLFAAGVLSAEQGEYAPGIAQVEESLGIAREIGDPQGIAVALNALAVLHRDRGDFAEARKLFEEVLGQWRQLGDQVAVARTLSNLANVVRAQRDFALARSLYEECLSIFRELGDQTGMAWSLNAQGDTARDQGDERAARSLYEQALAIFNVLGDRWGIAGSLADLGNLARDRGDFPAAHAHYRESLKVFEQLGHKRGIARLLECFACSAAAQCKPERSLRLAGAAAALRHALGAPLTPADQHMLEKRLETARQALGGAGTASWAEGWELAVDQAIAAALTEER